ncbi:MAG TPA: glycosyltransferase [Solirubrobacteraceae bacterium]|nr:glycosyltransferase [Solirubrobacteraceae bacterium]
MADDWGELMPGRRDRFADLYARIAAEADEIIVVNPSLVQRFPGRGPLVIRNGVSEIMLTASSTTPDARTLLYVGTLTPRFDSSLMKAVMSRLTDWRLELVGACMYPGLGEAPAGELRELLSLGPRVTWHGPVARTDLVDALDRATVAIIPNRPERSLGQDSMKLYDYAARGRPIVSTRWSESLGEEGPPGLRLASSADEFVAAILDAAQEPVEWAAQRRGWAHANTWRRRWAQWSAAVFGTPPTDVADGIKAAAPDRTGRRAQALSPSAPASWQA